MYDDIKLSAEVRELLENRGQHTGFVWLTPAFVDPPGAVRFHQLLIHDEEALDFLATLPGVLRVRRLCEGEQPEHIVDALGVPGEEDAFEGVAEFPEDWGENPFEPHEMLTCYVQMTLGRSQLEQRELLDLILTDYFQHRFQGTEHEQRSGYQTLWREENIMRKKQSPERVMSGPGRHHGNRTR